MANTQMAVAAQGAQAARPQGGLTKYTVNGQEITLSHEIVKNYLTKGNGAVSQQEVVTFIGICKYNGLNPFLNEAYLIKFGSNPATMVVSKEALFKRAEDNPHYKGIQAGVIVKRDDQVLELEGCFTLDGDVLLGGWAKVYRDDREYPIVEKVNLSDYDTKKSSWNSIKNTMIAKVAKVQALREAFPQQLGAMYTADEQNIDIPRDERDANVAQRAVAEVITPAFEVESTPVAAAETSQATNGEIFPDFPE